jgi:MoaA/NifB/PqqE/SkfB family radical SAM enzyme
MRPSAKQLNSFLTSLSVSTRQVRPLNGPTHIFLEVTNRCNLSCVMCGRTHDRRYKDKSFLGDMSLKLAQALDGIYGRSSFVVATGLGEPFLNPEFISILRYLKEKKAIVSLTSNGTLLGEKQARALVDEAVDRVVFSIDSPDPETFKKIRLGADLNQILKNIERLADVRERSGQSLPYMILEFVAMAKNLHQLPDVADLARALGFDEVIVQNLFKHFAPGYNSFYQKNRLSALEPEQVLSYWNEFQDRLKRYSIALYSPFQNDGIDQYLSKGTLSVRQESRGSCDFLGYIDRPKPMEHLHGSCRVTGWALGKNGFPITEVSFENSTESLDLPLFAKLDRKDVLTSLPSSLPQEARCGFDQTVDISSLEAGVYTLTLKVREQERQNPHTLARQQVFVSSQRDLRMYCSQPWSTIYVSWDGKVRTCCFNEYLLGDLAQNPFSEIWRGKAYRDLRRRVIRGEALDECADCLAGKSTPNYVSSLRDFFWG